MKKIENFLFQLIAEEETDRCRQLIVFNVVSIMLFSCILTPLYFVIEFIGGIFVLSFSILFGILLLFFLPKIKKTNTAVNLYLIYSLVYFSAYILITGGIQSPFIIWLILFAPMAYTLTGEILGNIWFGIVLSLMVFLYFFTQFNEVFPNLLEERWYSLIAVINFVALTFYLFLAVNFYEKGHLQIKKQLEDSNKDLTTSNEELERFAYIASHDLKSPIRNIISFLNLIKRRGKNQLDDELKEYLTFASESALHMHALITDVLEYSKTGNQEIRYDIVDLNFLFKNICKQIKQNSNYAFAEIHYENLPKIKADPIHMFQLFQNLIENGLKYNKNKIPRVEISYHFTEGGHFYLYIKDNGIGIDLKFQNQIFEPFKRLHNKTEYEGTGIGLAICKKIIEKYGGSISMESELNKGTLVCVKLPVECISVVKEEIEPIKIIQPTKHQTTND